MPTPPGLHIVTTPFGCTQRGQPVQRHTLTNDRGLQVQVMDLGATLLSVRCPDRHGVPGDVVLGFDALDGYLDPAQPYLGAVVGRHANRIARGRFTLDGQAHSLACNNGPNHLHGGLRGFDKRVWQAQIEPANTDVPGAVVAAELPLHTRRPAGLGPVLCLRLHSPDGEEGYPGALDVQVRYALSAANELLFDVEATCSGRQATVVNLAQHAYFNLAARGDGSGGVGGGVSGSVSGDVLGHELRLPASRFTPVDDTLIPTGELRPVAGTPMDFLQPRRIGERLQDTVDAQLRHAGGYDHNWVLDGELAAELHEPLSGRMLRVRTTQPGVQFYSGNFLDGSLVGRGGMRYPRHAGLCLETQHFPDAPNQQPHFPSTRLAPGERLWQRTVYQFGVRD